MDKLPAPIMSALFNQVMGQRSTAFLELSTEGDLITTGGDLERLGFHGLEPGQSIESRIDMLDGMIDPEQLPIELPFMPTPSGIAVDIYLFSKQDRIWIMFVDIDDKLVQQQDIQQRVNELKLTKHRHSKILNQYLGREVAERLDEGLEKVEQRGERRNLTILFADIRGFSNYSEQTSPEEVFDVLNVYLGTLIPVILECHGVLDKIIGDEVMAIFGMLDDNQASAQLGLQAAMEMLAAVEQLNRVRKKNGQVVLQIGIGMATGPVALGVLGSEHRKSITVIGNHVNLAARLQGIADAGQLVIDHNSYQNLSELKSLFSMRKASLKGYSSAIDTYQLTREDVYDPTVV